MASVFSFLSNFFVDPENRLIKLLINQQRLINDCAPSPYLPISRKNGIDSSRFCVCVYFGECCVLPDVGERMERSVKKRIF